ncbi:MAG: hypothetical protein J0M08_12610 [Bacteroidetes bacterium]|nr:hypothetical protein [Bacteroidota bacterium]
MKNYFFLLFVCVVGISCSKLNKDEPIPCYIRINTINLLTNYPSQGSSTNKFTDAWVYVDDKIIGIFELPVVFPVIATEGIHEIKIRAGIKNNGVNNTRVVYPVCDYYTTNTYLFTDSVIVLNPTVTYFPTTTFKWLEDFEGASLSFTKAASSDTIIKAGTSEVFEGLKSGLVELGANDNYFEAISNQSYSLPASGRPVYLEFNYHATQSFEVGVYVNNASIQASAIVLNPTESWNKMYLHLTPIISSSNYTGPFKIYFKINKSTSDGAKLLLDNIKLVHS